MDVRGTSYETFEELLPYCRRVAGTIGRLCLAIFGLRDAPGADRGARAEVLADDLGVALQLTNILRDVREDAESGRIYLPAQDLGGPRASPAGTRPSSPRRSAPAPPARSPHARELGALVSFEAERAREWFDRGLELADDARSPQRRVPARDGGHLPPAARAHRRRAGRRAARSGLAARTREGAGRRARHAGGGRVRRVVVVGGGLAGIAAALDCAQAGAPVTLVEVRRRLGGAAYSFERDGLQMDNGQHVFLRCCTAYRGLLERLGSGGLVALQPRLEIPVLAPGPPDVPAAPRAAAGARAPGRRARALPASHSARALRRGPRRAGARASGPVGSGARRGDLRRLAGPPRPGPVGGGGAVGSDRAADAQPARGGCLARAGRLRLPDRPALERRRRRHRLPRRHPAADRRRPGAPRARRGGGGGAPRLASGAPGAPRRRRLPARAAGRRPAPRSSRRRRPSSRSRTTAPARCSSRCSARTRDARRRSAARRSSTCTSSTTAACSTSPSRPGVGTPVQYLFDRTHAAGAPAPAPVPRGLAVGGRAARWS